MNKAYLLTGGNLGNRQHNLQQAKDYIEELCGTIVQYSAVYKTKAWGITDQPDFYNQAMELDTQLHPECLMRSLLQIEEKMGRERIFKFGPRIIDIDILLFNNDIIHTPVLTVPHPYLPQRRFALMPLNEIAGNIIHPLLHKSINIILKECNDKLDVYKISE